jgi:hypothetical protein
LTVVALLAALAGAGASQAARAAPAADHRFDGQATQNLQSALHLDFHESMYAAARMSGDDCIVSVDGRIYRSAEDGGRGMQTIVTRACVSSYQFLRGGVRRTLPPRGLHVRLDDLDGRALFSDDVRGPQLAVRRDAAPAGADRRSAYVVVDHYPWPCSDNGGFGEKVIVASHRRADLEPAFMRWLRLNGSDKKLCMHFEAYVSQGSFASRQPDLQYTNNPNSGYEAWIGPDGRHHVLHQ